MAVCASCVFGAVSSTLLSFSYSLIEMLTVSVIPQITEYTNGSQITNYETITLSTTEAIGSGVTFSNIDDITWTVDDAILTYPTTYVRYLGFKGAPLTSDAGQSCAQDVDATSVTLPSTTVAASFIYPSTAGMILPTPLLEYLGQLDGVAAQFHGGALTGCALLNPPPITARNDMAAVRKRFERPRSDRARKPRAALPFVVPANNTISEIQGALHTFLSSTSNSHETESSSNPASPSISGKRPPYSGSMPTMTLSPILAPGNGTHFGLPTPTAVISTTCFPTNGTANSTCTTYTTTKLSLSFPEPLSSMLPTLTPPAYSHMPATGLTRMTGPPTTTYIAPGKPKTRNHTPIKPEGDHDTQATGAGPSVNNHPAHPPDDQNDPPKGGHHAVKPQIVQPGRHPESESNDRHGARPQAPVFTVGKSTLTAKSCGVVIGSRTVRAGQKITLGTAASKTTVALETKGGSTRLVIDGTTYSAQHGPRVTPEGGQPVTKSPQVVVTTNGHTITAVRSGSSIIVQNGHSTTTIPVGSKVVFDGETISAPLHGSTIVINGKSEPLTSAGQRVFTTEGHTITAIQSGHSVVVQNGRLTTTILPGSVATFDGQTISAPREGGSIVINGDPMPITTHGEVVITTNGHTFTAIDKPGSVVLEDAPSTDFVKDGSVVTFAGQTVSVLENGSAIVVDGSTVYMTTTTTVSRTSSPSRNVVTAAESGAHAVVSAATLGMSLLMPCILSVLELM